MIKGIIFDMDGLLVDSERLTYRLMKKELESRGLEVSEAFYKSLLGRTYYTAHPLFVEKYGEDFDDKALSRLLNQQLIDCYKQGKIDVKAGVIDLLEHLKEHHIKTIVATSSTRDTATACLTGANLIGYFDDIICGDEVRNGKPDPEVFIKAAKKIGCTNDEVFVFEDSEAGIQAGYNAGMKVICIPDMKYPSKQIQSLTYKIFETIDLAIPLIK